MVVALLSLSMEYPRATEQMILASDCSYLLSFVFRNLASSVEVQSDHLHQLSFSVSGTHRTVTARGDPSYIEHFRAQKDYKVNSPVFFAVPALFDCWPDIF